MKTTKLLIILIIIQINAFSQHDFSTLINKKVEGIKDTSYTKIEFVDATNGLIHKNYTPVKYQKYLYILKINDEHFIKYTEDINNEILNVFSKYDLPVYALEEVKAKSNISDETAFNKFIYQEFDAIIIITISASYTSKFSLTLNSDTWFYNKTFINEPFIKVSSTVSSNGPKVKALTAKAMRTTFYYGLIRHKLLIR